MNVALLAGGTGGAKLAVGIRDVVHGTGTLPAAQPGQLSVIANTADDIEIYGVHVSPDPDLISFRLAGVLNENGYGIEGELHTLMDARRAAGEEVWFELGDDDMAVCAARAAALEQGSSLTEAHALATAPYPSGGARVLPMSDLPVRTEVNTPEGQHGIQQFLIQQQSRPEVLSVEFSGLETARASAAVIEAIKSADLVVVGPSNPVISVAPILLTPGVADALRGARAPVLGVSPIVGGTVLKGPTAKFLEAEGFAATSSGVAAYYAERFPDVIDAWFADDPVAGAPHHLFSVELSSPEAARTVAAEILRYGGSLAPTELTEPAV
jgi:LPPG:FO 2-phospho-L-lactate transferase